MLCPPSTVRYLTFSNYYNHCSYYNINTSVIRIFVHAPHSTPNCIYTHTNNPLCISYGGVIIEGEVVKLYLNIIDFVIGVGTGVESGRSWPLQFCNFSIGIRFLPYKSTLLSLCGPPDLSTFLHSWVL